MAQITYFEYESKLNLSVCLNMQLKRIRKLVLYIGINASNWDPYP